MCFSINQQWQNTLIWIDLEWNFSNSGHSWERAEWEEGEEDGGGACQSSSVIDEVVSDYEHGISTRGPEW